MLKKAIAVLAFAASTFMGFNSNAQVYEKGNMVIDAYYGWPNGYTAIVRGLYQSADYDVRIGSIGPVGARFEYLLSEKIGIGLHANFARTSVAGTYDDFDASGNPIVYDYSASSTRLRIMPSFNLHFGNSEKIDPYLHFAVGYKSSTFREETSDPDYTPITFTGGIPVAFRAEFGTRFFFTDNLGALVMVGLSGGPLVGAGLSAKF